jgi:hypothetical protein
MKRIFLIVVLTMICGLSFAQEDITIQADVQKVLNVPIYIYSYPIHDYYEVATVEAVLTFLFDEDPTLRDRVVEIVKTAKRKRAKGKIEAFDAIIIDPETYTGILIRFYELD